MKRIICIFIAIILTFGSILYCFAANDNIIAFTLLSDFDPDGKPEIADYESEKEYLQALEDYYNSSIKTSDDVSMKDAIDPSSNLTTTANLEYTISGLPISNTIQNFHIGVTYIYTTQKKYYADTNKMDVYISRALMNGNTATVVDYMVLEDFGHNQILTPYDHNGQTYFWIGLKKCADFPGSGGCFTTQIGRIKYTANKVYTNYNQICRFGYLNYANNSNVSMGKVKRVDAALSSDKTKLLLGVRTYAIEIDEKTKVETIKNKKLVYSVYDNEVLNEVLDEVEANPNTNLAIFKDNTTVLNACYSTVVQNGSSNFILPNSSCQGLEFSNADSIYISGGAGKENIPKSQKDDSDKEDEIYMPKICKMIKSGDTYPTNKVKCISLSGDSQGNAFNDKSEIEGLQLKGDYVYFAITGTNGPSKTQRLYSVAKSVFSTGQVS